LAIKYFKKHAVSYCILILLAGSAGCGKQEDPPVNNGTPLFGMQGTVNGIPFFLQGGVSDYYMFTQTKPLEFGLLSMGGKLARQSCPETCGPSLKIYFRNYTLSNTFDSDSLLQKKKYAFYSTYTAKNWTYELRIRQRSSGSGSAQYGWDFGNNRFSQDAAPVVVFAHEGIYPILCTSVYPNCYSELTQPVYLTPTRVGQNTDFSVNHIDSLELLFNSIPINNNNATVTWDFGDGTIQTGTIVKHRYTTGGIYKVCMQYVNGADTMDYCQNVQTLNSHKCLANYHFTTSRSMDSLQYKTIVVEWTDNDGTVYSSINTSQDNSSFEITGIEPYQVNTSNQQTKKLNLIFSCKLSNGTKVIQLNQVTGTFAIAMPTP
jgi:hypothetical protein